MISSRDCSYRYSLNSAHGAFTKLFKRVFPNGLENYSGPSLLPMSSEKLASSSLTVNSVATAQGHPARGLFSRLTASAPVSVSSTPTGSGARTPAGIDPEGALEELIFYGVAFGALSKSSYLPGLTCQISGFGLFNLVFSLLPAKIKSVHGVFLIKHFVSLTRDINPTGG